MFAALGSCASIEHIQEKSSACVEILQKFAHDILGWFRVRDFNRRHTQVSINSDISALCLNLSVQKVHNFTRHRKIYTTGSTSRGSKKKPAVRDILKDGLQMLSEKNMFNNWLERTGTGGVDLFGSDPEVGGMNVVEVDDFEVEVGFAEANGNMEVDCALDPELEVECPFSNVGINTSADDN
jgi:hypothetical protein